MLSAICGMAVGLSLGLTGGGGSILAVPLLVYVLAVQPQAAVSISLAAVGATAAMGAVQRLMRGEVEIKTGSLFVLSGVAGAPLGTWIGGQLPEVLLLILFAALMAVVAFRMWRKANRFPGEAEVVRAALRPADVAATGPACRRDPSGDLPLTSRCFVVLLISGVATGVLSGLFGVGGGFVIVPALVLLTGLDIHRAVATSLMVIAVISGAALVSHLIAGREIPWGITLPFSGGGVAGLLLGTWVGQRVSPVLLQKIFSLVIMGVAAYVMIRGLF